MDQFASFAAPVFERLRARLPIRQMPDVARRGPVPYLPPMAHAKNGRSRAADSADPRTAHLWLYVAGGLILGVVYAAANTLFDVLDRKTPLVATLALVHSFVDRGVPLLAGALIGVAVHYWRLRSEVARRERLRADDLGRRLEHVERDQAVWLVATATLHEVKNPLHSLGLLLEEVRALEDDELLPGPSRKELLDKAGAQMRRIDESIRALRAVTSTLEPTVSPLPLGGVVRDVTRGTTLGKAAHVEVAVEPALEARGDRAFVRIILENLIQNGLEATSEVPSPRVRVTAERTPEGAVVRVLDNGPGIGPESRATLFEPLSTSKARGMGLGLSVSRALARAMNGDVVVTDVPGWSTCLELRLPT